MFALRSIRLSLCVSVVVCRVAVSLRTRLLSHGGMNSKEHKISAITALLFTSFIWQGWGAGISRSSSNPIRVFQGFDATFQWTLSKNLTSRPDFKGLVFGLWKNGYLATYITTVTRKEEIIQNPDLKVEAPQLDGRVQWKGDLSKSLAAFQISDVSLQDQMDYGLLLNFGPFRDSPSDAVRLEVKEMDSIIKALPSLPATPGKTATFHCEFRVREEDKALYEGIAVGIWQRGGIYLTLLTVTNEHNIVINPKLDTEGPEYIHRVHGYLSTNKTNNSSKISVELTDVKGSDERSYGCSMYFGPFREPLAASVTIDVQDSDKDNGLSLKKKSTHDSREVRVGKDIMIPCPVLSDVIELDGAFKSLYWSYCTSRTCNTAETTWSWMAGMNSTRNVKVTHKGPYAGRVNLTRNGTLVVSNVRLNDSTDYRCTVQRVNFTSPRTYFFTLVVNATAPPKIIKRSKDEVTVVEGNPLFLVCEAEGFPVPLVTWTKDGKLLQNSTSETDFVIHDATKKDQGHYKCDASNSAGTASYTVTVEVTIKGKPGKKLTTGEIVLLAVGVPIAVVLIVAGVFFCACRRRKHRGSYVEV